MQTQINREAFNKMAQNCFLKPYQQNALPIRDQSKQLEYWEDKLNRTENPAQNTRDRKKQESVGFQYKISNSGHTIFSIIHQPKPTWIAFPGAIVHYYSQRDCCCFRKHTASIWHQPPMPYRKAKITLYICSKRLLKWLTSAQLHTGIWLHRVYSKNGAVSCGLNGSPG